MSQAGSSHPGSGHPGSSNTGSSRTGFSQKLAERLYRLRWPASPWNSDAIIREELFSTERLEEHAATLAAAQQITDRPPTRGSMHTRLKDNESVLLRAYRSIAATVSAGQAITPAAEWLLDNHHLVEAQIRQIKNDLPPLFYRQLPKLAEGPFSGYPRVFGIAWAYVAHSDSRFDPETLRRFVRAYQQVQPLTIGELWAIAITLRIVLIENLRRAAERIVGSRIARQNADRIADRLLGRADALPLNDGAQALTQGLQAAASFEAVYLVQIVKRLRDQDPRITPSLQWLEQELSERGITADAIVHEEHQRQGASNVTVRNIITSMRLISDVNWPEFFEEVSLVDAVLRDAPDALVAFNDMDFATRNLYRSAIEQLARGSKQTELQVTHAAIVAAHASQSAQQGNPADHRARDPGYHLMADGRVAFETSIGYRAPARDWPSRCSARVGPAGYISAILVMTLLLLFMPLHSLHDMQVSAPWWLAWLGLVPAVDLAVALVNRIVTRKINATRLPALALRQGIPEPLRTLVVVPTLLTSVEAIEAQIDRLEVHYLTSGAGALHFALLTDFSDAQSQRVAGDEALLQVAEQGIARLNEVHGSVAAGQRFYLLHRRRLWNEREQCWMGWERKRGKLHELNRLLRGASDTSFIDCKPEASLPTDVRFVVTLDADTRLPRETLQRLVGKLAHPLNQPQVDAHSGRIVAGYAVLQPRVTPSLPIGREGSLFQRVFSGMTGIDAYDAAVSDVYQDLFGAGSYAGKGIYDVDAFTAALAERVPENTLLSHDLFEGTFARAGLASDVEVIEEFPASYDMAAARSHRWARGDWQLLPWLLGRAGPLPLIGGWKMLDNLRRTLSAPTVVAALVAGWFLPWPAARTWTVFILSTLALPPLLPVLRAIMPSRHDVTLRSHVRALGNDLWLAILQIVFSITLVAHQAWLMLDAITRTLYRLCISKRKLLEWTTAAQLQLNAKTNIPELYWRMRFSVLLVVVLLVTVSLSNAMLWLALPLLLLWLAAPAIAWYISISPQLAGHAVLSEADTQALRLVARRTWRYFETFVTADDHWLPPDNFQEDPQAVLARRTSPTNMGLYLLCVVSARDFGWASLADTTQRLSLTLATFKQLQRYRGHFFNWYDTRDLRALDPRYVSSVDSGNLAAHLITLANACQQWRVAPPDTDFVAGLRDTLQLVQEALQALPDRRTPTSMLAQFQDALTALQQLLTELPVDLHQLGDGLARALTLAMTLADSARALASEHADPAHDDLLYWSEATRKTLAGWQSDLTQTNAAWQTLQQQLLQIATTARQLALDMEFDFLLDADRKLLSIGFNTSDATLDSSCYDLLASEARLASFFAIAKNDVAARHWFRLGRSVTAVDHGAALISWSGSMFEYLMPSLVMRAPVGSLLEQTSRLIVRRQIGYGAEQSVPWGVSESAYSARDLEFTYQYSNFGVPGLGLKRGLSENLVIAPYATGLAAMVDPVAAARNFERLRAVGAQGRYGFYEALDYTRARLPDDVPLIMVRAYMAHHQGMTIVAIQNVLFDGGMRARFHAEPSVQATELLLQERTPRDVSIAHPRAEEVGVAARIATADQPEVRRLGRVHYATPQTHLLSNGRYSVMLSSVGSGYSRWRDLGITRWREDATRDDFGSYIFVRDVFDNRVWSVGYQPTGVMPDSYQVTFTEDRAEFIRSDGPFTTTLHVVVSPEDDAEVRRVTLTNSGDAPRELDITSYCELVLAPPAADNAHPAFSKMFVQTEYVAKAGVLLATRRRRGPTEPEVWVAHHAVMEGDVPGVPEYETDRARFVGRGHEMFEPIAVLDGRPLSNTTGTVLDPIFALRYRVTVAAGATMRINFWTAVAGTRDAVLELVDKHQTSNAFTRAATLSWTQAQVQLRHLDISAEEANLFQRLAGHVLYANDALRPASAVIERGSGTASALWAQGISGDLPIVLVRIDAQEDIDIVRQLLRAHEYWRLKQLAVDLVILNERAASYVQDLQIALETLVRMSQSWPHVGVQGQASSARGAVFVLRTDLISVETRGVLSSAARLIFVGQRGSVSEQLARRALVPAAPRRRTPQARPVTPLARAVPPIPHELAFFNGVGGFTDDGREYVITLDASQSTPAPWLNVIANPHFGFQISAEGSGYTWAVNSRENQLTQWCNDPVTDRPGEVLYLRDEESGALWGPSVAPLRDAGAPYRVRHGQGYSCFEHQAHDIASQLWVYVPRHDPIKICRLILRNDSRRVRKLSVTAYVEWVLGTTRATSAPFIITHLDDSGAVFARNPWNAIYATRVAFADLQGHTQHTADRCEFLGRHGRLDEPAGLVGDPAWSGRTGAGLDPCAALQKAVSLAPGEAQEVIFLLGEAASVSEAQALVTQYRAADLNAVLSEIAAYWDGVLGKVQVRTPDHAMNIMLNRWLLYQTLVCRVWARSAFYQASGAYGYRDQLQDGMALALAQPALTREHLLRAAGRQFPEGDVQHWWLPPTGQGVRTHISDDRIWLAYAALQYLNTTGDTTLLDESIAFIEGPPLDPAAHDAYFLPNTAELSASFYEHCARGLDASLAIGAHGLPLIGTGDWNDGMNRVGEGGRGESVWLGWFLHATLTAFAKVARARDQSERAAQWLLHAASLREALEREAWDGAWYRRGFFDDGTAFGSSANDECRIDSIAQSWSVISGAAEPLRAAQAMAAVDAQLLRRESGLALLFTPPFDRSALEPGYVKGYPPGLRENGGQYTHAATWLIVAFAKLGEGDKAAEVFNMLNPIQRSSTRTDLRRYKVEPYAVAADIYSVPPHVGRGGWTWYTGAAGWLYRAGLENMLGVQQQGQYLLIKPCIPKHWPGFELRFKHGSACYEISVENPQGVSTGVLQTLLDEVEVSGSLIPLVDDGVTHRVLIRLGT